MLLTLLDYFASDVIQMLMELLTVSDSSGGYFLYPLATSRFWFALPIVILLWVFLAPASWTGDRYDSDFGWLCLIYIPFHYISFLSNVIGAIKSIFDID